MRRNRALIEVVRAGFPAASRGTLALALALALALGAMTATSAGATVVPAVGLDQMVSEAELIVHGTVAHVESHWAEDRSTIYTFVGFEVQTLVHGELSDRWLKLRFEGGEIGDFRLEVDGMPSFREGDEEILFVRGNEVAVSPVVGFFQGRFRSIDDRVHDHAGLPIVGVSGGTLVKLADGKASEASVRPSIGSPEGRSYVYGEHPDHDRAEGSSDPSEPAAGATDRYPEEAPGKGTGIDDTRGEDPSVVPAPVPVGIGVSIEPGVLPVVTYLERSEDSGERLTVDAFLDIIRSRLDR